MDMSIFSRLLGFSQPTLRIEPRIVPEATLTNSAKNVTTATRELDENKGFASFDTPGSLLGYSSGYIPSDTNSPSTPFTSVQVAAVYACTRALSEDIAKLPIRLRRRLVSGGSVVDTDHPINKVLWTPNPFQTPFDFKSYLVFSLVMQGNSYAYVIRSERDGRPLGILPIMPTRVNPMIHHDGDLYYYISHPMLDITYTTMFDMIHLRNVCLDDGFIGISPIAASQNSIGIATASQKASAIYFAQGMKPSIIASTDKKLDLRAKTSLAQQLERAASGVQNYHKALVLEDGLKASTLQISPEDSQLIETRKFSVEEIARIFSTPLHRIGAMDKATFNNVVALNQQYIDNALMPIANKIEQAFDARLLFDDERDKYFFRFDFDEMLRGDTKSRYESYQIGLLNGFLCRDEVRVKEGYEPIPDGTGKEFLVPLNTGALDAIKPGSDLGKPTPPKPKGETVQDDGDFKLEDEKPE